MKVRMWPLNGQVNEYIRIILSKGKVKYTAHLWSNVLDIDFEVFHMHWPETYLNEKLFHKRILGTLAVLVYILFIKVIGKRIVWTVHNTKPHENRNAIISNYFYRICVLMTDEFVFMSKVSQVEFSDSYPLVKNKSYRIIYHPLYYSDSNGMNLEYNNEKFILYFGIIRPYKNVPRLIEQFGLTSQELVLKIMGSCKDVSKEAVVSLSKGKKVQLYLERYSNKDLGLNLNSCEGVVIPYRDITNSGVLYQAISYGVRILIPRMKYTEEVVASLNYRNVQFYDGEIDSNDLDSFCTNRKQIVENFVDVESYNMNIRNAYIESYSG